MSGARILVVDDDPGILRALRRTLAGHGYEVHVLDRGGLVAREVRLFQPQVVLLDVVLPDADGIDVCRQIRATSGVPIIMLSVVGDDAKKVSALDEGADDYLTKPFSTDELQARIRVALRHSAKRGSDTAVEYAGIRVDVATHLVNVNGQPVHFTRKEFDLLRLLVENAGRLLTARHLLTEIWGSEYADDTHVLRTLVHQVRNKLALVDPALAALITNDPGVGYRIESAE